MINRNASKQANKTTPIVIIKFILREREREKAREKKKIDNKSRPTKAIYSDEHSMKANIQIISKKAKM